MAQNACCCHVQNSLSTHCEEAGFSDVPAAAEKAIGKDADPTLAIRLGPA